jgi:hypothetical protein
VDSIVAGLCEGFTSEFLGETFKRSIIEMFIIWRYNFNFFLIFVKWIDFELLFIVIFAGMGIDSGMRKISMEPNYKKSKAPYLEMSFKET